MAYEHPSLRNLVPDLAGNDYDLDGLAKEIIDEYRKNRESRSDWEEMHARWVRLYYQLDKPSSEGRWSGASDESIPILTEACNQYHTRMYQAMFANRRLVTARPTGRASKEDLERAERISLHMTWQLTRQNKKYKRDKDRLLLSLPVHGSMFTKTYRDPSIGNMVKNVRAIDLILPYGVGPKEISEIPAKTEVVWSTVNDTMLMESTGYFSGHGTPTELVADWMTAPDIEVDRATGIHETQGIDDLSRPVLLLESHRLMDLDGDGLAEPYIVVVDAESEQVLRIAIRWETDELGNPVEAGWYDAKKPIEYYTQWNFLENPDGTLGLGFGHILGQLNQATNRLLRETVDAGMLANIGNMSGFVSQALGIPGGEIEMELGKFAKIPNSSDDIRKGIYNFQFPGPNQALFNSLQLLLGRADRLGLNTEAVTGQLERTLQPTTILALLEESNKGFGSVNERVVTAWGDELNKIYHLNYLHMAPEEYFAVLDVDGSMIDQQVARDDYRPDMEIEPFVDPQMKTEKERLQKAQMEFQTNAQNPLVMMDPTGMALYNTYKRFYQALRIEGIEVILPNPLEMAQAGIPVSVYMAAMMNSGKDETGLTDGQAQGGSQGVSQGAGGGMVPGTPPSNVPGGELEDGSNLGGIAPGAGANGSY